MTKKISFLVVLITLICLSTSAFAAWNVPINHRIVQKTNVDNIRVFTTIQAALDSIPASAPTLTNPYVIKVMPGVYDLGTASLQMKEYVDLEGSGPDRTVITSSNNNVDGATCTVGTVLMANNTAIRNIKVVNSAPNLGGDYITVAALVFNNVEAKAEGLNVVTGSDTVPGGQNNGVCTYGVSAHAILNSVNIETHNNGGQSNAIQLMGGDVTLTNSTLAGFNGGAGSIDIINNNCQLPETQNTGTVTVINSKLEGTCSSCGIQGITAEQFSASVSNSVIALHGPFNGPFVTGDVNFSMENTKIITDLTASYNLYDPSKVKVANSLLPGNRSGLAGTKLINCYDENYNPIPNQ